MDVLPLVNTSASQGNGPDHQAQIPQVERERERERERRFSGVQGCGHCDCL